VEKLKLTDVSKTAIATLRCRMIESERIPPLIHDPMAKVCLGKLLELAATEEERKIFDHSITRALSSHIALRARKYDAIINTFIGAHPGCTVINLGCGFDTRYWRIDHSRCSYIELDLPEVIELKKKVFGNELDYELIGLSVLDPAWIEQVTMKNNHNFILVAEGLFMYLPRQDVMGLFKKFAAAFNNSQIVFETVTESYTRGFMKKMVEMKIKAELGLEAGSSYGFGVKKAKDIEGFADGIKEVDEWSYVEDMDVYPKFLKYMGIARTQWTVTATINE
jgi:O-methyltransferase involved in polyketide biosynthesis